MRKGRKCFLTVSFYEPTDDRSSLRLMEKTLHHFHTHSHSHKVFVFPLKPPGINIGVSESRRSLFNCGAVHGIQFTMLKLGGPRGILGAIDRQYISGARFFPSTVWTKPFFFDFVSPILWRLRGQVETCVLQSSWWKSPL